MQVNRLKINKYYIKRYQETKPKTQGKKCKYK